MLKVILIFIIVFLIVRAFVIAGLQSNDGKSSGKPEKNDRSVKKGVPKEVGEYIEFEDVARKS